MMDPQALMERAEWMQLAECRGMNPELFFPARGDNAAGNEARAVCRRCDVQAECLAYAMNSGEHQGIWGGLTELERRRLRRKARTA